MAPDKKKKENKPEKQNRTSTPGFFSNDRNYFLAIFFILILTVIAYLPSLKNDFAWDDSDYIKNDDLIHSINFKNLFSTYKLGNYHPLTMLVFALEYQVFSLRAGGYHIINLLFHLLNVVLVFFVVKNLLQFSQQDAPQKFGIAFIAALLFGIHPIHVESVAWISELKDLLYATFFLSSLLFYLKFLKSNIRKFYFFSLLLFLFSLLSKGMATSLPLTLLLMDYFTKRKMNTVAWIEKIPFFILSLGFGIVAVMAQHSYGSIQKIELYSFPQRIVFACYGFITYLFKLLLPLNLNAYYPYPIKNGDTIPASYYIYPILFLIVAVGVWLILRNSYKFFSKKIQALKLQRRAIIFGLGFFFVTVFLVLQLLPVGNVIMADRYSYIPSVGIFFIVAVVLVSLVEQKKNIFWKRFSPIILTLMVIFFATKTYSRCRVWKNDVSLWSDVINQGTISPIAYYNHGMALKELALSKNSTDTTVANMEEVDGAIIDFTQAIQYLPSFHEAYNNRGNLLRTKKNYDAALSDYKKTLELKPDYAEAYYNRGQLMMDMNRMEDATKDFQKAVELNPKNADAYNNLGIIFANKNDVDEALKNYNHSILSRPENPQTYYNRGNLLKKLSRYDEALSDYNKAIAIDPNLPEVYNNRGLLFMKQKKYDDAIHDFNTAAELQPASPEAYFNRALCFTNEKKLNEAIQDFTNAIQRRPGWAEAYFNRANVEYNSGQKEEGCSDLKQAAALGSQAAAQVFAQFCK